MGTAAAIRNINASELECSICLENIQDDATLVVQNPDNESNLTPQAKGLVCSLPCNVLHMFHPDCIRMWLDKSAACPLCKLNAFTG